MLIGCRFYITISPQCIPSKRKTWLRSRISTRIILLLLNTPKNIETCWVLMCVMVNVCWQIVQGQSIGNTPVSLWAVLDHKELLYLRYEWSNIVSLSLGRVSPCSRVVIPNIHRTAYRSDDTHTVTWLIDWAPIYQNTALGLGQSRLLGTIRAVTVWCQVTYCRNCTV